MWCRLLKLHLSVYLFVCLVWLSTYICLYLSLFVLCFTTMNSLSLFPRLTWNIFWTSLNVLKDFFELPRTPWEPSEVNFYIWCVNIKKLRFWIWNFWKRSNFEEIFWPSITYGYVYEKSFNTNFKQRIRPCMRGLTYPVQLPLCFKLTLR